MQMDDGRRTRKKADWLCCDGRCRARHYRRQRRQRRQRHLWLLAGRRAVPVRMLWVLVLSTFAWASARRSARAWARSQARSGRPDPRGVRRQDHALRDGRAARRQLRDHRFGVRRHPGGRAVFRAGRPRFFVAAARRRWRLAARRARLVQAAGARPACASFIYLLYIVSAFLAHPHWGEVLRDTFLPDLKAITPLKDYVFMIINVIGTTITPWGQFYIQSSVRDKGIRAEEYGCTRLDVLFGAFFTNLIAFFIIVCCGATLFEAGIHHFDDAGRWRSALKPLAGRRDRPVRDRAVQRLLLRRDHRPLSTAYAVTESLGWESGVGRRAGKRPCSSASSRS